MRGRAAGATRLFVTSTLIASLSASLVCGVARGDDLGASKPTRIPAAAFGPIGKVFSLGEISINGRTVHGEQMIWGSELLQAADDTSVCVLLDSIGEVRLMCGATVRLATRLAGPGDTKGRLLVASLTSGDIVVKLDRDARAYIESCGSAFISSGGASFRVGIRQGEALVDSASGVVRVETQTRRMYILSRVNPKYDPNRPPKAPDKDLNKIHAGETVPIANLAKYVDKGKTNQEILFVLGATPNHGQTGTEQPASNKRVRFTLSKPIGELSQVGGPAHTGLQSITVVTDNRGVATVSFTGGPNPDSANLTATVEDLAQNEDVIPWTGDITIVKARFWTRNKILIVAAGVAGTAAVIIIDGHKGPIRQQPPPVIP